MAALSEKELAGWTEIAETVISELFVSTLVDGEEPSARAALEQACAAGRTELLQWSFAAQRQLSQEALARQEAALHHLVQLVRNEKEEAVVQTSAVSAAMHEVSALRREADDLAAAAAEQKGTLAELTRQADAKKEQLRQLSEESRLLVEEMRVLREEREVIASQRALAAQELEQLRRQRLEVVGAPPVAAAQEVAPAVGTPVSRPSAVPSYQRILPAAPVSPAVVSLQRVRDQMAEMRPLTPRQTGYAETPVRGPAAAAVGARTVGTPWRDKMLELQGELRGLRQDLAISAHKK